MPYVNAAGLLCGTVMKESRENGSWIRRFFVLNQTSHRLLYYTEDCAYADDLSKLKPLEDINCQYITKVGIASSRPRLLNCFEIGTTTITHILAADSAEERDEWIETLRKASMRQSAPLKAAAAAQPGATGDKKSDGTSYQTKIVGGVVIRTPIQQVAQTQMTAAELAKQSISRGFPRVIRAGHGIKIGAVMKTWKKRFFVLNELSWAYYKSVEESEPIRSISLASVTKVGPSDLIFPGKEHLFQIETPARTFYIQGETKEDTEEWIKAFQQVITGCRSGSLSKDEPNKGSKQLGLFNQADPSSKPGEYDDLLNKEQSDDDDDELTIPNSLA
ncbi:pleckstrin homology domain-containing family A member 2-like isoform X2 [Dysidea avara]|uniref:pleckstrin homology domain-containing family A member 2-like isoform X2 n=1 Tax=Dysidea avara TaxID=196820 RepID=UPI00331ADCCE